MKITKITVAGFATIFMMGGAAQAQAPRGQTTQSETEAENMNDMEAMEDMKRKNMDRMTQQETAAATDKMANQDALQGTEPVVPVGPAVVPVKTVVKQVGPAVIPVTPVDDDVDAGIDTDMLPSDALEGVEAVAPVGPTMVPVKKVVKQVGPATVPAVPVEKFEGVETATLQTENGPVVVISFPGTVPSMQYNIDFSALDGNSDGYISKAELDANSGRSAAAHNLALEYRRADTNADNRLGFTEILGWVY